MTIDDLKFDENGLIPAIIQDAETGKVVMFAFMNRESLEKSIKDGLTCFWSRSRGELWLKGEASGNFQHIKSIYTDCDHDALLINVSKDGPACHTGADSCFFNSIYESDSIMNKFSVQGLYELLKDRKKTLPEGSYTSYLFEKGLDKILKKVGEECTEVIIAAKAQDKRETVYEIADLMYHVMVLMVEADITPDEVKAELASRHIIDHKIKQEKMV